MKAALPLALASLLGASGAASGADEPSVLAEQASGIVPLEEEVGVVFKGFTGKVVVWGGEAENVRFEATILDGKTELPVRVSSVDRRLVFEPSSRAPVKASLTLVVPIRFGVRIDTAATRIEFMGIGGAMEVKGKDLSIDLASTAGPATFDLEGGSVRVMDARGDVAVRGKGWKVQVGPAGGRLGLYGGPGSADIQGLGGGLDADVEGVRLQAVAIDGTVNVTARGGSVDLAEARSGGDLRLAGGPLVLARGEGSFNIASDNAIRFTDMRSYLRIEGEGASLEGTGNTEGVEMRTHDAKVLLNKIDGPVRVEGHALAVVLKGLTSDVRAVTTASSIEIGPVLGRVGIDADGGEIRLTGVAGETSIASRGGNVRVAEQSGQIQVDADGPETQVEWTALPRGSRSLIDNRGGKATVRLPTSGDGCRVEARSSLGRIDIDASQKRIVVSEDGSDAQGWVGTDTGTVVRVQAEGDIRLWGGPPAGPAQP